MKKIRYLIFGLIFACLGLTSFSSACSPISNLYYHDYDGYNRASESLLAGNYCLPGYNGLFCFDIAGTITTPKGGSFSFTPLSDYTNCVYLDNSNGGYEFTSNSNFNFDIYLPGSSSSCDYSEYESTISTLSGQLYQCNVGYNQCAAQTELCDSLFRSCQTDLTACLNNSSGGSCSNTGTVSDLTNKVLLYTGSVSLNNSSYTNIFNYGNNGAGTYCVKLSSSSPQTLTFGFANGGTTTPTNLYQLYNDQYGQVVCLYGNKPYFNAKLNSSSNTVSYEIYKLSDLYSSNVCLENECETCQECEDCSSCESSLSACQEDNESLTNMNTSLNDQLQQCLVNGGTGCDPEVDSGCVEGATVYSLFWNQMGSDFSLPITNNLFLLSGMRAYSDSGVVSLGYIDSPVVDYSMDSDSSDRLIKLVVGIFEILSCIIFVVVAGYYIKKFLSYVLFPYKK